jgi:transcriptional regulator NrdR family protein
LASLHLENNGEVTKLDGPISFEVKPIRKGVLKGASYAEYNTFRTELTSLIGKINEIQDKFSQSKKMLKALTKALERSSIAPGEIEPKLEKLEVEMKLVSGIQQEFNSISTIHLTEWTILTDQLECTKKV